MATKTIDIFSYNILEDGTTTAAADTTFPKSRLYDWSSNFYWRKTAEGDITISVDQGASNIQSVDTLWIADHNFNGSDCTWEYSGDNATWSGAAVWTQGDANNILKIKTTAQTSRYWQLTISGVAEPQCGEVLMSDGISFDIMLTPTASHTLESQVSWTQSISGQSFGTKKGSQRREIAYNLRVTDAVLTNINTVITNTNNFLEPTLIKDKDGTYALFRFSTPPVYLYTDNDITEVDIRLSEVQ